MEKLLKYLFWVLLFSVLQIKINANSPPNEIYLPRGSRLKGLIESSFYSKKKYVEFRGLRYAKPPIGDLRFKVGKNKLNCFRELSCHKVLYSREFRQ